MRKEHLLFSAFHLFVVLLILSIGGFCFFLAYSKALHMFMQQYFMEHPGLFMKFGVCCFLLGLALLIPFYGLYRKQYLTLKMSGSKVLIEESIIHDYVKNYWKELFPNQEVYFEIAMHRSKTIEILAKLPLVNEEDKESFLKRIQNELGVLLARKLGYEKEFFLTISSD